VKRMLLVLGAALLFIQTLALPTVVRADGGGNGTGCGSTACKP